MFEVESVKGKQLDVAVDAVAEQIRFICGELPTVGGQEQFRSLSANELNILLGQIAKVRSNVRVVMFSADLRLRAVESALRLKISRCSFDEPSRHELPPSQARQSESSQTA